MEYYKYIFCQTCPARSWMGRRWGILKVVQKRNIEAILEILNKYKNKNVVIGTYGTVLSTILNYFYPDYNCNDFLRIIDFMPYIIRLDFDGENLVGKEEVLIIKKEFKGAK